MSHSIEKYNSFGSFKNKKYLDGNISKHNDTAKQFLETENKMQKQMKDLKKQNKIIFKLDKKSSSCRDLNKINKIDKSSYDYSSRNISSVSINSYYSYSSISPLSDW